jgi:hypothetical protein
VQFADIVDGSINLLDPADSDVETSMAGWFAEFNCSAALSNAVGGFSGSQAIRLTSSAAGDMGVRTQASKQIPVVPGNKYSIAAWVFSAASARNCTILAFWKNAAGGSISNVAAFATGSVPGAWQYVAGNGYTAPAGAAYCDIQLRVNATAGAGEVHYYDAVMFVTGSQAPTAYMPGSGPLHQASIWKNVRNGDALAPNSGGTSSITDYEAPFGVQRLYRATTYVYDTASDHWQQSTWSLLYAGTLTPKTMWALTNPFDSSQGLVVRVQDFETVSTVTTSKLFAVNRDDPIVMTDGGLKYPTIDVNVWALTAAERAALDALCAENTTLLLRNFYGESWYIRLDNEFHRAYLQAVPLATESTPLRDAKTMKFNTQAVRRPSAGPTSGPLVEA